MMQIVNRHLELGAAVAAVVPRDMLDLAGDHVEGNAEADAFFGHGNGSNSVALNGRTSAGGEDFLVGRCLRSSA